MFLVLPVLHAPRLLLLHRPAWQLETGYSGLSALALLRCRNLGRLVNVHGVVECGVLLHLLFYLICAIRSSLKNLAQIGSAAVTKTLVSVVWTDLGAVRDLNYFILSWTEIFWSFSYYGW